MDILQNKKTLILIGILIGVVLLVMLLLSRVSDRDPDRLTIPDSFTGYKEDEHPASPEEVAKVQDSFDLYNELPVETKSFKLTYSEVELKFVVKLPPPTEENKLAFFKWLLDKGYENIPEDEFIFVNYNAK